MTAEIRDDYDIEALQTQFRRMGYQYFHHTPETDTTMTLAEDYAKEGRKPPAAFSADYQRKGIGRASRVWYANDRDSILVSGFFEVPPEVTPIYTDLATLYVCRTIAEASGIKKVDVKYPNDPVINDKKVGGILIRDIEDDSGRYLGKNVGIGINVHYSQEELDGYPTDYGATALDLHTPKPNSRQAILVAIFGGLRFLSVDAQTFQTNLQFQQDQNNLWKEYSSVYLREVEVKSGEEVLIRGKVVDTQISNGILIENPIQSRWFNLFGTTMSVRLLN